MTNSHFGPTVAFKNDLKVIACYDCGRYHLDPLPDPRKVSQYYQADKFYTDSDQWFHREADEHRRGLWDAAYHWQVKQLRTVTRPCSRLIDLGTGAGWFVHFWNKNYGSAVGVEPSRTATSWSPCFNRLEANLSKAARRYIPGSPVYLRAALVLEHLPDPVGFLKEALTAFLGALAVMVIVPNEFNPLQLRLNKKLPLTQNTYWLVKDHVNYFNPVSLRSTMVQAGLEVVFEGVTAPMELFPLTGLNYIGNDKLGVKCHQTRLQFETVFKGLAFGLYQQWYKRHGWGRELVFIGVNK